jgi:hypothetical protein
MVAPTVDWNNGDKSASFSVGAHKLYLSVSGRANLSTNMYFRSFVIPNFRVYILKLAINKPFRLTSLFV